jgi:hypothetical protein
MSVHERVFHLVLHCFSYLTVSISNFNVLILKRISLHALSISLHFIGLLYSVLNPSETEEQKQNQTLKAQQETGAVRKVSLAKGCNVKSLELICCKSLPNILQWAGLNGQFHRRR